MTLLQEYKQEILLNGKPYRPYTKYLKYGKGILSNFYLMCKSVLPCGHIVIVALEDVKNYVMDIERQLTQQGYKVSRVIYPIGTQASVEDAQDAIQQGQDTRLVIAVGSGTACEIGRYTAFKMECEYLVLMTAPTTDSIFYGECEILDGQELIKMSCNPPIGVMIDLDTFVSLKKENLAGGYGLIFSKYFSLIEREIMNILNGNEDEILKEEMKVFENFFSMSCVGECLQIAVAEALIKLGLIAQCTKDINRLTSEQIIAQLADKYYDDGEPIGEKLMLSCICLISIYNAYLKDEYGYLRVTQDISSDINYLAKECKLKMGDMLKNIHYSADTLRNDYIINEYRSDFQERLNKVTDMLRTSLKRFKRIYPDAGYSLGERYDLATFFKFAMKGGWLCPNGSLLRQIKNVGLL